MKNPRCLRAPLAPLAAVILALALSATACGEDADPEVEDTTSSEQSTPPQDDPTSPADTGTTAPAAALHECAELWNAADLDEVRSVLAAQHRQDSAESGQPDLVVGHYGGEPFVLTAYDTEVTVPDGACVVVDVDGTTVDAPPQYGGYAAALVDGEWASAVTGEHPLAQDPLPVTDPQLVRLDGGVENPVLVLP
ncbi:hypothetical protein [Nocardioides sp. SYSU DS0651]|uniref:hypothetical protein n=1 Tax=Nocardioides sp. SYSU DS0651 TaxID=3415955 RepID=UPI003F4B9973